MKLAEAWKPYWEKRGKRAGAWPWLRFAAECVSAKARVLDVGCGDGQLLELLDGKGCRAEGIDVLPEAVAFCRSRGLQARVGDFLKLRHAGRYDAVVFSEVLAFVAEPEAFLVRARSLLAPNGIVIVTAGNAGSMWARLLRQRPPVVRPPVYYRTFTEVGLRRLAKRAGYRISTWNSFSWVLGTRYRVRRLQGLRARHFVAVLEPR